jgi:hypothetical protein
MILIDIKSTHITMEKFPSSISTDIHNPPGLNHSKLMETSAKLSKPKRRKIRPPLKPGLTVHGKVRQFVEHKYTDRANERVGVDSARVFLSSESLSSESFPLKLFKMLSEVESLGLAKAVSWFPHGRAFAVFDIQTFTEQIMPIYFSQTKWPSFLRQLSLYGFTRLYKDPDRGGYYHENFLRGRPLLASKMIRRKIKGTKFKAANYPETEPNFYAMPFVTDTSASTAVDPSLNPISNNSSMVNPQSDEKPDAKKQMSKKIKSASLPAESRQHASSLTMQRNPPIVGQIPDNRAGTMNPNLVSTLKPYGHHLQNPRLLTHPNHSFLNMPIPNPVDTMPLNDGQPKVAPDLSFPHVPYLTANNSIPLERTFDTRAFANNMDTSSSNPLGRDFNDSRLFAHSNFPSLMQKPNMMERVSDDCAGSNSSDYTPGPLGDDRKYSKDCNSLEDRVVNNSTHRHGLADDHAHSSSADNTPNPVWDHSKYISSTRDVRDVSHWKQMVHELEDENFRLKMRSSSLFRLCQDLKEENQLLKRGVQYENSNSNGSLTQAMSSKNYGMRY